VEAVEMPPADELVGYLLADELVVVVEVLFDDGTGAY
jgi:hypothetical protein